MRLALLAAASALTLAACGQPATTPVAAPPPMETPAAPVTPAVTADSFVQSVANSDAFEIQASRLVATKGVRADVKTFAAMMVRDHTATSQQLTALAPQAGLTAPTPTIDAAMQANVDALNAATSADFDATYIAQQIAAHQAAVALFQNFIAGAVDGPLKTWANETLPKLQDHLARAQALSQT